VVVAGGRGQRFGGLKQFEFLAGRRVLEWSVGAARSVADGVVAVLPEGVALDPSGADVAVHGGPTRSASVRAGLAALPPEAEVVVVHDAARPLAGEDLFRAVTAALLDPGVDGAVPALPVAETVKRVAAGRVVETVPRQDLVVVQTPQAFRASALVDAHRDGDEATDDACLVEARGGRVVTVPGDPANLKITSPADMVLAEALLRGR